MGKRGRTQHSKNPYNKEFDSFGYEADDKYVHFTRGEEKEYFYLKHFKMELHKSKVTNIVRVVVACCCVV